MPQSNTSVSYTHLESGREAPEIFLGLKAQGGMLSGVIVNPAKEPAPREKEGGLGLISIATVSYTHLDVYKRQALYWGSRSVS